MNTLRETRQKPEEMIHASKLLDVIAQWPDWKLQALCLDESDLEISITDAFTKLFQAGAGFVPAPCLSFFVVRPPSELLR